MFSAIIASSKQFFLIENDAWTRPNDVVVNKVYSPNEFELLLFHNLQIYLSLLVKVRPYNSILSKSEGFIFHRDLSQSSKFFFIYILWIFLSSSGSSEFSNQSIKFFGMILLQSNNHFSDLFLNTFCTWMNTTPFEYIRSNTWKM